jgi:hypothetical protein
MGPLHFAQFWLDEVTQWRRDTGKQILVGLSTPKDVQDAILADPKRSSQIDVIDFNYWWQTSKGLFAPKGGQNMSPRQEERKFNGGKPTDVDLARMTAEYKARFPQKAIISGAAPGGWAYLCAGGSLPKLPFGTDLKLLKAISQMQPWSQGTTKTQWTLREKDQQYLVYSPEDRIKLDLRGENGTFGVYVVESAVGRSLGHNEIPTVKGGTVADLPGGKDIILWLRKWEPSRPNR